VPELNENSFANRDPFEWFQFNTLRHNRPPLWLATTLLVAELSMKSVDCSERRFWRAEAMSFMVNRFLRCRLSSPSRRRMRRKAGDCERPPIAARRAVEQSLTGRPRKIDDERLA
jgi:hypothetical protein